MAGSAITARWPEFVRNAAAHGAAAVAISPVHAQFSATLDRFSPYSPSSRTALNVLHATLDLPGGEAARLEALDLVDWPAATRLRLDRLDAMFAEAEAGGPLWDELPALPRHRGRPGWRATPGSRRCTPHITGGGVARGTGGSGRTGWPMPASPAVARFAAEHARDVSPGTPSTSSWPTAAWPRRRRRRSRPAWPVGLVSDLAVGVDSGGSQCWAHAGPDPDRPVGRRAARPVEHARAELGIVGLLPTRPCS